MIFTIIPVRSLDLAPWTWKSSWNKDMPSFFQNMPSGVYDNIYDDLDDSPVSYHTTEVGGGGGGREPVDPTEYQNEYIGKINALVATREGDSLVLSKTVVQQHSKITIIAHHITRTFPEVLKVLLRYLPTPFSSSS
eukprot:766574-Hanusia_phi.AAC.5